MASSTALTLVNRVLRLTNSNKQLAAITGSTGGVGERIIAFLNLVISDVEKKTNWPFLRVNAQGTGDGVNDIYEYTPSGSEVVEVGGPVSVWIAGKRRLDELTPEQFDRMTAEEANSGQSLYFQRGVSAAGNFQVQIFPTPANGDIINISAFQKGTRLTETTTSTTEFPDDIFVYVALMHMDAYEGQTRGYAQLYADHLANSIMENYGNRQLQVEIESYT